MHLDDVPYVQCLAHRCKCKMVGRASVDTGKQIWVTLILHHLQCCCLGIAHIFGDLVVTSPPEPVEIPRTYVRFSPSFPEEDLCPVHEFSWWSLGRNAVGQANDVSAVEGDWLILDHAGRLKFQSRLVATGAIVIGRDDGLPDTSLPVTIQMRSKASW